MERKIIVADILKEVFKLEGIEFKSSIFLRWRVIDDRMLPRVIESLTDLIREFTDGSYQFTFTDATISGIEKEPFTVPEIVVEVAYQDGQWSEPRLYTDYECFGPEHNTPQALQARLEKIKEHLKAVLPFISLVVDIAKFVSRFFAS